MSNTLRTSNLEFDIVLLLFILSFVELFEIQLFSIMFLVEMFLRMGINLNIES